MPLTPPDINGGFETVAQQARVQGVVIMEARVDEQGVVSDVRTLRSIPLLDQAAPGARFQLRASYSRDSHEATVSVFSEDGQSHLGDMMLTAGGQTVQSPTTTVLRHAAGRCTLEAERSPPPGV